MPNHTRRGIAHADDTGAGGRIDPLEPRTLLAADPVTQNHPLWVAERSAEVITIDGRLDEPAWAEATPIERSLASLPNVGVSLRMLYGASGLKIGATIRDPHLYADGDGPGAMRGKPWDYFNDDALALYFDVAETRATEMPASGRMLAFNPARFNSKTAGKGVVWRRSFAAGDPASIFGQRLVNPDGSPPAGLTWQTTLLAGSTLGKTRDTDVGWQVEINIPWSALGLRRAPVNGRTMGMNFQVFFDNNGREIVYGDVPDFASGERYDAKITAAHGSEGFDPRNGWPRPVGYAVLQFAAPNGSARPRPIDTLSARAVGGYGAFLDFVAPAGTLATGRLNRGHVSGYEVRLSDKPITAEAEWEAADRVRNSFTPKRRGEAESLRIAGLVPGRTYHVAVRATDSLGRIGAIGNSAMFTTLTAEDDPSGGERIIVSPDGAMLVNERLEAFPMIGGTVGIHNLYVRGLYSGGVWTEGNSNKPAPTDFSLPQNHPEGEATDYFAALAETGVNVLRLQLEWLVRPSNMNNGAKRAKFNSALPNGIRWLEWRDPGSSAVRYNDQMREFLHRAIEAAHAAGVRFVLQTTNNFNYEKFFDLTALSKARGGPLDRLDQLFDTTPAGLEARRLVKDRLRTLADWVRSSPHPETVIGFELYNEWDGGIKAPARPARMTDGQYAEFGAQDRRDQLIRRAKFLEDVSRDLRAHAPGLLIFGTTIGTQPDGPLARALFYSDTFDVLNPHFYTPSVSQPVYNTDADRSFRVARDYGAIAAYWLNNRADHRPIHNGEWDITSVGRKWPEGSDGKTDPYYSDHPSGRNLSGLPTFTLAEDEANYRVASWSNLASGLAGAGWRIGSGPLADRSQEEHGGGIRTVPLTAAMRSTQGSIASFIAGDTLGFDWSGYRPRSLAGSLSVIGAAPGQRYVPAGSTDGSQGMVYIVRDSSRGADSGALTLRIDRLTPDAAFTFELRATDGTDAPPDVVEARTDADGRVTLALPPIERDLVVRFRGSWLLT